MTRISALTFVLVFGLVAGACGDDDGGLLTTTTGGGGGERYSTAVRDSYLEGCTQDAPAEACECTISEFEARYTESEFIRIALENADAETMPPEFLEIIEACLPG